MARAALRVTARPPDIGGVSAPPDRRDDAAVARGVLTGDPGALDYLYARVYPMVVAVVTRAGGQPADAEDLFQEGLVALWRNLEAGTYEVRPGTRLSSYLVGLCRNRWIDRTRRASFRRERHAEELPDRPDDFEEVAEEEREARAREALAAAALEQLGERCRELLTAFYFERRPLAAIAAERGIGAATAKNEKYRCMQRLRKLYAPG